jgi:hypothetical protein
VTEDIGVFVNGTGAFTQSGGTNQVGTLNLRLLVGSNGTYNLMGGSLSASNEFVGNSGIGAFTQNGGTNRISNNFFVGHSLSGSGTYTLNDGSLRVYNNETIGNSGIGAFTQSGGTNRVAAIVLGNLSGSSGTYDLSAGSLSTSFEYVGFSTTGAFTQSGGTDKVVILDLASNSGGSGTFNLQGGSLSATTININAGGTFNVTGTPQPVTGNVINSGTVHVSNATVTWNGTFTNNGAYVSNPSTQTFSDLTVQSNGYLVGGAGDLFKVSGNFVNNSTQNTLWNTAAATLQFTGTLGTNHNLSITGPDNGPTGGPGDFSWATLKIDDQIINLLGDSNAALYVGVITGVDFTGTTANNINGTTSVLNIYYDPTLNGYLNDATYIFASGSGKLIPTPLLASVLLLGSGLLGLGLLGRRRKKQS